MYKTIDFLTLGKVLHNSFCNHAVSPVTCYGNHFITTYKKDGCDFVGNTHKCCNMILDKGAHSGLFATIVPKPKDASGNQPKGMRAFSINPNYRITAESKQLAGTPLLQKSMVAFTFIHTNFIRNEKKNSPFYF